MKIFSPTIGILTLAIAITFSSNPALANDVPVFDDGGEAADFMSHLQGPNTTTASDGTINVVLKQSPTPMTLSCSTGQCIVKNADQNVQVTQPFGMHTVISGSIALVLFKNFSGFTKQANGTYQYSYQFNGSASDEGGGSSYICGNYTVYTFNAATNTFVIDDSGSYQMAINCVGG